MEILKNIVVTDIDDAFCIFSKKGRKENIQNRQFYGLSFTTSGRITYTLDGKEYISDQNGVILHPKNRSYSLYGNSDGHFNVIDFDTYSPLCDTFKIIPINDISSYLEDFEKIRGLSLFKENKPLIFSTFYKIIDRLIKDSKPKNDILYPAINYLKNNINDMAISNADLAKKSNISEIYFRRLFSEKYGTTPKQYILEIRIQKAKRLLTDTALTISAVAEECGFTSVYTFSRAFKNRTGLTPTEYSKRHKTYKI